MMGQRGTVRKQEGKYTRTDQGSDDKQVITTPTFFTYNSLKPLY